MFIDNCILLIDYLSYFTPICVIGIIVGIASTIGLGAGPSRAQGSNFRTDIRWVMPAEPSGCCTNLQVTAVRKFMITFVVLFDYVVADTKNPILYFVS